MNNFTAFRMFLCVLFAGFVLSAAAQGQTVTGVVSGTDGQPLPGVTVIEQGTTNGVSTAVDGSYSLRLQKSPAVLVFSYIGYESAERSVPAGQTQLSVTLNNAEIAMDDVVVVGYGTVKRSTLTSSVASVKSDEFVQGAVTSPLQLLQGRVAGLAVNTTSGDPNNSGVQVMLRGVSTLTGSQEPLIVIDGISGGSLSNISVDDIESIDILKDGSAAAIYGTRGTNGVILITTKKGSAEKRQPVTFTLNLTFQSPFRLPDFQNRYGVSGGVESWGTRAVMKAYDNAGDFFRTGALRR